MKCITEYWDLFIKTNTNYSHFHLLTDKVDLEQVLLVEFPAVKLRHGLAYSLPLRTDVTLQGVQGVGEGVHAIYNKLYLGVLLVAGKIRQPVEFKKILFLKT